MTLQLPPAGLQCIVKPFGGGAGGPGSQIGGGNQTIGTITQLPEAAVWVRFRLTCWSPEDVKIVSAAYTPTTQLGDGYNAYDEAGAVAAASWRPITFGNIRQRCIAQSVERSAGAAPGCMISGIREAGAAGFASRIVASDWLPYTPLPRGDGGAGSLINVRLYAPAAQPPYRLGYAAAPALDFVTAGAYAFGDHASAPFGGAGTEFSVSAVHGLDVICARPTRTLIIAGDSIGSGDFTTGGGTSYGLAAALALTSAGQATTAAILANPLQTTPCFIGNAYRYLADDIDDLAGAVIVIQCWSGNDAASRDAARQSFGAALALASFCQARGVTPILATAAPVCAADRGVEEVRVLANALVRAAGLPILDIDRLVGAGTSPNSYRPGFGAWDNVHLSDAGQLAVARALAAMILA